MLLIAALQVLYLGLGFQLGAQAHAVAREGRETGASIAKNSQEVSHPTHTVEGGRNLTPDQKVLDLLDPANVLVSIPIPVSRIIVRHYNTVAKSSFRTWVLYAGPKIFPGRTSRLRFIIS